MTWFTWIVLLILAAACWRLSGRVDELAALVRELRYQAARLKGEAEEERQQFKVLRAHTAALAGGQKVSREQVLEGRFYSELSGVEAYEKLHKVAGTVLVDVRTEQEFMLDHATGAVLVPLDDLSKRLGELPAKDKPVLLICQSGGRSQQAAEYLAGQGWSDVTSVRGGTPGWPGPHETRSMMKLAYTPPRADANKQEVPGS